MKVTQSHNLGEGFHAHLRDDGSLLITGKWAEDTILLEKQSVDLLRQIMAGEGR